MSVKFKPSANLKYFTIKVGGKTIVSSRKTAAEREAAIRMYNRRRQPAKAVDNSDLIKK